MIKILEELKKGRTISVYKTGNTYGYDDYYRWDDSKIVVNSKSIQALKRKKLLPSQLKISNQIIKY